jgi:WD40 repeat protein
MARVDDESVQAMAMGKVFKDNVRSPPAKILQDLIILRTIEYGDVPHIPLTHCRRPPPSLTQTSRINSLDFYKTGEHLVTASDDESIHVYNAVSGKYALVCSLALSSLVWRRFCHSKSARALSLSLSFCVCGVCVAHVAHDWWCACRTTRTVLSKKYGVDLIRWTHNENAVICASKNSWDGTHIHALRAAPLICA